MASFGSLIAQMALDQAKFSQGLQQASASLDRFAGQTQAGMRGIQGAMVGVQRSIRTVVTGLGALGAVLGARQFAGFTKAALDSAGGLGELARSAAVTTKELQQLQYGATAAGVSAEQLQTSLQQFGRRLGEAGAGAGKFRTLLSQLGISARDASGQMRSSVKVLHDFADAIRNAESDQERLRLAMEAFGRGGARMVNLLADGSAGLRRMAADARAFGAVMSDELIARADAASDRIATMGLIFRKNFDAAIVDAFTRSMGGARSQMEAARDAGAALGQAVGVAVQKAGEAAKFLATHTREVGAAIAALIAYKAAAAIGGIASALMNAAKAAAALNLALVANPIGLIAGGVAAATAAVILLKDQFVQLGDASVRIGDVVATAWENIGVHIAAASEEVSNFASIMQAAVNLDLAGVREAWGDVGKAMDQANEQAAKNWRTTLSGISLDAASFLERIGLQMQDLGLSLGELDTSKIDPGPVDDLGDAASSLAPEFDRAADALAGLKRELEDLEAGRNQVLDDLNHEIDALRRRTVATREGAAALAATNRDLEVEVALRRAGVSATSDYGKMLARLTAERYDEARALEETSEAAAQAQRELDRIVSSQREAGLAIARTGAEGVGEEHADAFARVFA